MNSGRVCLTRQGIVMPLQVHSTIDQSLRFSGERGSFERFVAGDLPQPTCIPVSTVRKGTQTEYTVVSPWQFCITTSFR